MTYSIVARDPETGELGVAAQSCWPAVGASVPWLEAGVGAVVTQAFTNVDLGPQALALLREGAPAAAALREVIAADPSQQVRQIGIVDATGRTAAHTGRECVVHAGHRSEADVSIQGNMLERPAVWSRMLDEFRAAHGDLAERLLAALRAGQDAGGDIRGSQSAVLLVSAGAIDAAPWARRFDLRVDDAQQPIEELGRLLRVARAFERLGDGLAAARAGGLQDGLRGTTAAYELAPGDTQIAFWHGVLLVASGQPEAGQPLLVNALREEPRLVAFASRMAEARPGSALSDVLRDLGRRRP